MIFIILYILFLLSGSYFISIYFDKNIEETIPIWMISSTLIVYFFGIFNALKMGFHAIVSLGLIFGVLAIAIGIKKKISLNKLLTPGVLFFIVMIIIAYRGNNGRMFIANDEFSHWGLTVKNMFLSDSYCGTVKSNLLFRDYPPASATFQYITLKIFGEYTEGMVFTAMNTLYFSLYVMLFEKVTYKHSIQIIPILLTVLLVPTLFFVDFFRNIMVDAMMGLFFAYALITYYTKEDSTFKTISISLIFSFLVLIKGSGIGLSIIAIIVILIDRLIVVENKKTLKNLKDKINKFFVVIMPLISSLFFCLTWKIYLKFSNITGTWSVDKADDSLIRKIINKEDATITTIQNYFKYHFKGHGDTLPSELSFFAWICIIILISLVVIYCGNTKKEKKRLISLTVTMIICCYIYFSGILVTYITSFTDYEAVRLASIDRYSYTFILGWLMLMICFLISNNTIIKVKYIHFTSIGISVLLLIIVNVAPIIYYVIFPEVSISETVKVRDEYYCFENTLNLIDESEEKLQVLHIESKAREYLIYNYMTTPTKLSKVISIGLEPYYEGDVWTKIMTPKEYADYLLEYNFEYVYISYVNEMFNEDYGELFLDNYAENCRLYSVHEADNDIGVLLEIIK